MTSQNRDLLSQLNDMTVTAASETAIADRIDSRQLFAARREIQILHGDETYRLRITSQNKLILTK